MSKNKFLEETRDRFDLIMNGYRMTTAEIFYHMPDHPSVLQTYIWQELDLAPKFPVLNKFLTFWGENLDGPLHSVQVAATGIVSAREMNFIDVDVKLH
jgi:uncharacterized protein Usg